MSFLKKKIRRTRWIWILGSLACAATLAGSLFWIWPLHIQASYDLLGELLSERPPPEVWSEAALSAEVDEAAKPKPAAEDYFPPGTFGPEGKFMVSWMAESLAGLKEASLVTRPGTSPTQSYRLMWLRSFDPAISVRLDIEADGSALLTAKHLALHPGKAATLTSFTKRLSRWRTARLVRDMEAAGFWTVPTHADESNLDGARWLFEGCREGRYHAVNRWSPENGDPFKEFGLNLLEAAGFWRGPVY